MTTVLWDDEKSKVEATYVQTSCDTVLINFLIKTRNISGRHTFFIPSTEIKPVILEEEFVGFTQINDDDIYVRLKTLAGEFRMAYYDFNDHVREEIRRIIISDFGGYEWESLYVEHDDEELAKALQIQKTLIEEKYGVCSIKKNFMIEDTIAILK